MFNLDSLICVTKSNILGNIPLHTMPPISGLEIMVHIIPSWMNGISRLICLMKYLILQFLDVRHTYHPFVPQHTLLIFQKTRQLLFLETSFTRWHPLELLVLLKQLSHGLVYLQKTFNKSPIISSQSKKTSNITDTSRHLPTQHILNLA
jgi:hypothetical protein